MGKMEANTSSSAKSLAISCVLGALGSNQLEVFGVAFFG
jgi:hypothetical protein